VDRLTRHQLKQDEFRETFDRFEEYLKQNYQSIVTVAILMIAVVGLAGGLKYYINHQEAEANTDLGAALKTFRAYVGTAAPGTLEPDAETFPTAQAKYKKALDQFTAITQKYRMYPQPKAVAIARYQVGICQALLGDHAAALKTLQEAGRVRDREIASLAQLALAGELVKSGKLPEAAKICQELADRPTLSVPKATALLALGDAYRASQPARARQIYEQVQKQFGSNATVAEVVKQQIASLPR
jgi:tetratricopeptide (TPR) repeat protein